MAIKLPVSLNKSIVEYLSSLPNINDKDTRRALILGASLDEQLHSLINFGVSGTLQFSQQLVSDLVSYGQLHDGRTALEAVLHASKQYVGMNRKHECELLIQEWRYIHQQKRTYIPEYDHDILVSYAFRDDTPISGEGTGWVTVFTENLRQQLNHKLGGADRYSLCMSCLDLHFDREHGIEAETIKKLRSAAILLIVLSQEYIESYSYQHIKNEIASLIQERTYLHSTVFLVERNFIEEEHRPPELCGLQSYRITDAYSYTNKLNQLGLDVLETLKRIRRNKISEEMICEAITMKSPKVQQATSHKAFSSTMAFINVDQVDSSLGDEIVQVLKKDIDCITPLRSEEVSENRAFFEEAVTMCEYLLIIYGKVRPQWVIRQVGEIRKCIWQRKIMNTGNVKL